MSAPHAEQLIEGYLARVGDAASDLPRSTRRELIDDMRAHIAEARIREPEETDATILNILDRLGEPGVVVADAREPLGLKAPRPYQAGLLEVAAVILVPFLWPVGVILLWMSPAWKLRDKIIGTLVPPGGYLGTMTFAAMFAQVAHPSGCHTITNAAGAVVENTCPPVGPPALQALGQAVFFFIIFILPLMTAGYLSLRLRWGRPAQVAVA